MSAVDALETNWSCPRCTLLNPSHDQKCSLCGQLKEIKAIKPSNINKDNYGSIIYRSEPFSETELDEMYALYTKDPSKKSGKYPIIIYPNNDINYKRDKSSDIALLSSTKHNKKYITVTLAKYDRKFCYGVVVQFHGQLLNYYKKIEILPIFNDFRQIMDEQFAYLQQKYLQNGHDIIFPSPQESEISNDVDSPHQNHEQRIFHNLGTYKDGLPKPYFTYIQQKINELDAKTVVFPKKTPQQISYDDDDDEKKVDDALYDDDEEEEEEKEHPQHIKFYKNDPVEVFNKNKNVWIRGIFIGEYENDKNVKEYFVEIPGVLESQIISIETKCVRYLQEMQIEEAQNENEEKSEELILETEQKSNGGEMEQDNYWDNVNEFVLREYIVDILEALPHLLSNTKVFIQKMAILGINSEKSVSRALAILESIKNERKEKLNAVKCSSVFMCLRDEYFYFFVHTEQQSNKIVCDSELNRWQTNFCQSRQ